MNRSVTHLVFTEDASEMAWHGCAAGAVLTINGSAGNSSLGGGFRARLTIAATGSAPHLLKG